MRTKETLVKVPGYVLELWRKLERIGRQERWIAHHLLPAPVTVRVLVGYFKARLHFEKQIAREWAGRQEDPKWYVTHSPSSYLAILEFEARQRVYTFLLATLRANAGVISRPPDPDRWKDPARRIKTRLALARAPAALEAVGAWWIEASRASERPHVTRPQREAFELAARFRRLSLRVLTGKHGGPFMNTQRYLKALKWETRRFAKELRTPETK